SVLAPIIGCRIELPTNAADPEISVSDELVSSSAEEVRARILRLLGPTPSEVDDVIRLSGAPAGLVRTILLELELAGRVVRESGGLAFLPSQAHPKTGK